MRSIKTVFKIGQGPSSSHTVGPYNAATTFSKRNPDADRFKVILYGSLAMTGAGHGTARAIKRAISDAEVEFNTTETNLPHPNTMDFFAYKEGNEIAHNRVMSIGGGLIEFEGEHDAAFNDVYPHNTFTDILNYCEEKNLTLPQYIFSYEDESLAPYLSKCWQAMQDSIERGLEAEGILPGGLDIQRKAKLLYNTVSYNESADITQNRLTSAFAYAVSEENASEGMVVTAPTCGSCGVIPAVFYYFKKYRGFPDDQIIDALAVAGLIGDVIITNASISGAECGCQAEIGSACSMAAGALASLHNLNLNQIEYAAELSMEHHLGLTCDPVKGLVQIPCIERNAVAAMRATDAVSLARFLYQTRKISFDAVIETMYKTGLDMDSRYKETAHGGLAQIYADKIG